MRDVTCPLCKEIAIEKPYSETIISIQEPLDGVESSASSRSNGSRRSSFSGSRRSSFSRRPSLSRLIRDTLDQHAEVYFMYSRNQNSSGFVNFMRNLLQTNRQSRQERRHNQQQTDEDVPPVSPTNMTDVDVTLPREV